MGLPGKLQTRIDRLDGKPVGGLLGIVNRVFGVELRSVPFEGRYFRVGADSAQEIVMMSRLVLTVARPGGGNLVRQDRSNDDGVIEYFPSGALNLWQLRDGRFLLIEAREYHSERPVRWMLYAAGEVGSAGFGLDVIARLGNQETTRRMLAEMGVVVVGTTAGTSSGPTEDEPYLITTRLVVDRSYNPGYGNDRICECGHRYERHFDGYENNAPVGCKHCHCDNFIESAKSRRFQRRSS